MWPSASPELGSRGPGRGRARGTRCQRLVDLVFPVAGEGDGGFGAVGYVEFHHGAGADEAAFAHPVVGAHGDDEGAGADEVAGDAVAAVGLPPVGGFLAVAADVDAVDVGGVKVVDDADVEHEVAACPGFGYVDGAAEPDGAVAGEAGVLPEGGQLHEGPGGVVVVGACPAEAFAFVAGVGAGLQLGGGDEAFYVGEAAGDVGEGGVGFDFFAGGPGEGVGAAPGGLDEADMDAGEVGEEAAGEVIGDGGEGAGVFWGAEGPGGGEVFEGGEAGSAVDFEEVDFGEACALDFAFAFTGLGEFPFHVGLAGAEPDFADVEAGAGDLGVADGDDEGVGAASGAGGEDGFPGAVGGGFGHEGLVTEGYGDF